MARASRAPDADEVDPQVEVLRNRLSALEAENEELKEQKLENDPRFFGYSETELEMLARKCEVRADGAPFSPPEAYFEQTGATAEERGTFEAVLEEFREQDARRKRELLIEVGADVEVYDTLDEVDREMFFFGHMSSDEPDNPDRDKEIQRILAEEKAGLRPRLSSEELSQASPYVRFLRGVLTEGDRFAELLTLELGAERVDELRAAKGGWPGGGRRHGGCPAQ